MNPESEEDDSKNDDGDDGDDGGDDESTNEPYSGDSSTPTTRSSSDIKSTIFFSFELNSNSS